MESAAFVFCVLAAILYSCEISSQERKLSEISPIVVTFFFGCGIMVYGLPAVAVEIVLEKVEWPSGWEWVLVCLIPITAFFADWAHFTAIYSRAGSILLATMYMAIPMFSSILRLESPSQLRLLAWLLTGIALIILARGKIFAETIDNGTKPTPKKTVVFSVVMALLATFFYSAEIVAQDIYLKHISSGLLATIGGGATAVYALMVILFKGYWWKQKLRLPIAQEWRWICLIPILSFLADFAHYAALHEKSGSVTLSMFYMTCPIWATFIAWKKPTKWHLFAWAFAAGGILLLLL